MKPAGESEQLEPVVNVGAYDWLLQHEQFFFFFSSIHRIEVLKIHISSESYSSA